MSQPEYPALLNPATQTLHPLRSAESFLVGRNETADICVLDPTCSRHHFRILRNEGRYAVEALAPRNPTYCNGAPVNGRQELQHGALIQAGQTRFQFLLRPPGDSGARPLPPPISAPPPEAQTVVGNLQMLSQALVEAEAVTLTGATSVIGREAGRVQVLLPHPLVSRFHARIDLEAKVALIRDLGSANGTFVNGVRVQGATSLRPGDQIDIGPYALQFTGKTLVPRPRSDNVELVARHVCRVVTNRETGQPLTLLDNVNLVIRPREFVCLLGPSGSGKSTLLTALSGRTQPTSGSVLLNSKDLYANFEALKQDMAVVPQKDVLHDSLTVGQALWYTGRLRLPPDTSAAEVETCVADMLGTVGLTSRRGTCIRHLSGGQIKRASLANEVLCKPSLLFLDEVTSGLDEQTDREMMNLFRSMADAGKTVVCITHSLANVERTCHLVVVLTAGGKLAFVGKPKEALEYFNIDRLGDVYEEMAKQSAEHWQSAFQKSVYWKRYVVDRLPTDAPAPPRTSHEDQSEKGKRLQLFSRQALLLTRRYFAIWLGDYASLLAMAGQALLVAVLMGILFGNLSQKKDSANEHKARAEKTTDPQTLRKEKEEEGKLLASHARLSVNLLFLLAVTSFWFGCNNAAKEVVKEQTIYSRERDFNLLPSSYYTSKLLLLTTFTWSQAVLLLVLVRLWCRPPGAFGDQLVVLLLLGLAGVTLGLVISSAARTEEMAITLIPMAVIPQIVLSGAIATLSGLSKGLAMVFITTYWGKRALDATLPKEVADVALKGELLDGSPSFGQGVLLLWLHAVVGVVAALALLHWQGRRKRG